MSLTNMDRRDAKAYTWDSVYDLNRMLAVMATRTRIGPVELFDVANARSSCGTLWDRYGDRCGSVNEAILLNDGSILVACTVNSYGGALQSHDDICDKWFHLIPPEPRENPTGN